jgi:monodehydroascorbate reductase (NADH)
MASAAAGTGYYCSQTSWALRRLGGAALPSAAAAAPRRRTFSVSAAAGFDNQNREWVLTLDLLHCRMNPCCK